MSDLYHCFQQSKSIDDFKARVFENRIQTRFSYGGPLKELLIDEFGTDVVLNLFCGLFSGDRHQETKAILEKAMERYYARALAEYYPKFEDYLYDELNEEKLAA